MHAVVATDGKVALEERPDPEPGTGELLVRVHAAGLNGADLLQRAGRYPPPDAVAPDRLGLELAGVVERCGPGVTRFAVGDAVMGIVSGGAQAELLAEVNKHEADRNLELVWAEFRNYQQGIMPAGPGARAPGTECCPSSRSGTCGSRCRCPAWATGCRSSR